MADNLTTNNSPLTEITNSVESHQDNETLKRRTAHGELPGSKKLKKTINLPEAGDIPHSSSNLQPDSPQASTTIRSETDKEEDTVRMIENLNANLNKMPPCNVHDLVVPLDRNAGHLFKIITKVFSKRNNCAYFNDEELDQVYTMITLSDKAQELLVQIFRKRNKRAHSCSDSKLKKELLEKTGLFDFDIDAESVENIINQLSKKNLMNLCRQFKRVSTVRQCRKLKRGSKTRQYSKTKKTKSDRDIMIEKLLKIISSQPGIPNCSSPRELLKNKALNALGQCIRLKENVISLLDRILTLFTPFEEILIPPEHIFKKLTKISEGTRSYPETRIESSPLFQDREHLVRYVEWRNKLKRVKMLEKAEDLEELKKIGNSAYDQLESLFEKTSARQEAEISQCELMYSDWYMCLELVTAAIKIFKKHSSLVPEAVKMLENLAEQENYPTDKRGDWYLQLASIQFKTSKKVENLEFVAAVIIKGLNLAELPEGIRFALIKKAENLLKKSARPYPKTESSLEELIKERSFEECFETVTIGAKRKEGNSKGQKSRWYIVLENKERRYRTVEGVAAYHYAGQGYGESWHCEGSLPLILFTVLMWEEIYSISVRMAYLSPYQKAPLDLYTSQFYNNRKVQIDKKIKEIEALSAEELGTLVVKSFEERKKYESVMPNDLKRIDKKLKDVVRCLGAKVVAGICQKMAKNFTFWKAGFPDLVVWNPKKNYCKIVEVKGPRTFLTDKQTLWLNFLHNLGADAELCQVKRI